MTTRSRPSGDPDRAFLMAPLVAYPNPHAQPGEEEDGHYKWRPEVTVQKTRKRDYTKKRITQDYRLLSSCITKDKVGGVREEEEWIGMGEETNSESEDPAEGEADGSVVRTGQQAGHVIAAVKRVTFVESALSRGVVDGRQDRHAVTLTKPKKE
ncbi:hypothetical protein DPEC_G00095360 [Dallia pectoralis]|uniref:Uncharacterized protein n=1 Tax=Dallia pectoralis TaxID=75939 RepID=A0ACC2GVT2_DALPE|nr:hypothetical protein DPEC_G00095360 [Dallia pectoralis]